MRYLKIFITMLIVSVGCNNETNTKGKSTESTNVSEMSQNDSAGLRINEFSMPKILENVSIDQIRNEIIARSEYIVKSDSLQRKANRDTTRPLSDPFFNEISNYDLVATYQTKLKERKVIYGRDNRHNVIYGNDSRRNMSQDIADSTIQSEAHSVVALISSSLIHKNSDGSYRIKSAGAYSDLYHLCSTERFYNEPVCANCSGFAIASNLIATAGHCLNKKDFKNYYCVFDLNLENLSSFMEHGIPDSLVYEFSKVDTNLVADADFCIARTKKAIPNFRIAKLSNGNIADDTRFYVLGFPCGLALKYTDEASLRSNVNSDYFVLDCDTYGGNSGSPVFNSNTNEVEGILVRGNEDFKILVGPQCYSSIVCGQHDCRGEDATKVECLKEYLNKSLTIR